MNKQLLFMEDISKSFSGVKVLDNVHFDVNEAEVHALVGENGAGKSTLMKILTGVYQKDSGKIFLKDDKGNFDKVEITSPRQAQLLGISIVYQEFNLLDNLSIAENIYLGREPVRASNIIDWNKLMVQTREALYEVGLDLDPRIKVENLSVAEKQMVEIAKALSFKARLIVMDEPTATLTDQETKILFNLITDLKAKGVSIIYISHRMEEIFSITDRITVMRDGKYIDTLRTKDTDKDKIVRMMVGREVKIQKRKPPTIKGEEKEIVLQVKGLSRKKVLKNINFNLHKGEILGFFGLVGAGRTELARVLFGIDRFDTGEILINGERVKIRTPQDAIGAGLGFVPEDRKQQGLVLGLSIKKNIALTKLRHMGVILWGNDSEDKLAREYIESLRIYSTGTGQLVQELSGGNQQKVVISKWLALSPKILILDEPTRGIDVGAKAEIHNLIRQLAEQGMSILMISSELPEILSVSDRVIAMHEGTITLEAFNQGLTSEEIMQAAVGGKI